MDRVRSQTPAPLVDLLYIESPSLNLNIGVAAIGPQKDFTIKKDWKSGHQLSGHQVVTK